ncbi:MAG: methionine aminotransferase [Bacteroidales bacterium]|nr:methionine aminotransferase [Bacteroidales bacterium]MCK5339120.1 methionine aminotransferase [Bacteroidales bacterium]
MIKFPGIIKSKLPRTGTSIFAVMSQLANEHKAINLSQGFPDFDVSPKLIELISHYMKKGYNQYAPMTGVPLLRERISEKIEKTYKIRYDPDKEINITAGATQGIYAAIACMVRDDDEVIIFEPAYDSYAPAVQLCGGIVKYARMEPPDYNINWPEVARMVTHRTRMIIINSPHNPTGSILREKDLLALQHLTKKTDIVVLSDEVYEHLIYDGEPHESVCKYPGLVERSFVIGSFGKTFHATGWKMGYVLAPENLMKEFRKSHQFIVFTCNTPVQHAIADYLGDEKNYRDLHSFYQKKRDYFVDGISSSRFKIIPCHGTYFQLVDYSRISDESEMDFATRLITEYGIGSIPVSPFYHQRDENRVLRLCFAKKEETLDKAANILCKI